MFFFNMTRKTKQKKTLDADHSHLEIASFFKLITRTRGKTSGSELTFMQTNFTLSVMALKSGIVNNESLCHYASLLLAGLQGHCHCLHRGIQTLDR